MSYGQPCRRLPGAPFGDPASASPTLNAPASICLSGPNELSAALAFGRLATASVARLAPMMRRRSGFTASGMVGLPVLIRVEDVVLALYRHMTRVTTVGGRRIGRKLAAGGVVVEHSVPPTAGRRKFSAVFLDDESLGEDVRHIDDELGIRALLRLPLQLHDPGAVRKSLAVAGNAGLVSLDHRRVGDDDLEHFIGPGGRDDCPILIAPEVGEGDSARGFQ